MTKFTCTALLLATTCLTGMAQAAEISRIELGQAGIARYTLQADTLGNTLSFEVPRGASDDVLASLVVRDPAGGVIDLQTETPGSVDAALDGSLFANGLPSTTEGLLRALVGEEVSLTTKLGTTGGRLLGVGQTQTIEDGNQVTRATALLLGQTGVAEIVLTPGTKVAFPEESAQRLADAMAAGKADPDKRVFDLTLEAMGPRQIDLSYVTEAAAWKNSWRLLLDEGRLQGWATLENVSGQDWNDVQLTLTTGVPVAYRRELIDPLFIARPDLPDQQLGPVSVEADLGAASGLLSMYSAAPQAEDQRQLMARGLAKAAPPARAGQVVQSSGILRYDMPSLIDLSAGRTANMLYIDLPIEPEIRGLYRVAEAEKGVILAAALTADQPLASGLVSVQDAQGFVGDAPFNGMLAGQSRLLPYAIATGSTVDSDVTYARRIQNVSMGANGVVIEMVTVRTTRYAAELPDNVSLFSVEHPSGFGRLDNSEGEVERGAGFLRVTAPVQDGKGQVSLIERRESSQKYQPGDSTFAQLVLDLESGAVVASPEIVDAFVQSQALVEREGQLRTAKSNERNRYDRLVKEQERLRKNLETVLQDALRDRYLASLDQTETDILAALDQIDAIDAEMKKLGNSFRDLMNGL